MSKANDTLLPSGRPGPLDRRFFLKSAAAAAAAAPALPALAATSALANGGRQGQSIPRESISIQLYTLRELPDFEAMLAGLAAIGYRKVEHAGFGTLTAAQFQATLQQAGLRATSGHMAIPQPWDESIWHQRVADAVTVGQRYIVEPLSPITYFPPDGDATKIKGLTTVAAWQQYAEDLNRAGAIARAAGLRFGFHNHFWEFAGLKDNSPLSGYDILLAETDPLLVHFELDLYWAWFAHRDPVHLIAYAGDRIRQFHVKDMRYVDHKPTFTDPGLGVIDFARIFAAAGKPGAHEYIVERDDAGANALLTARIGFEFLSRLKF
ncbi:MAG TPA: sugar phosphate isomerase/epimerase [Ideonella sp.]|nr:sugar phosphate isomerase/epimerase [Ideonella sp.]